VTKEQVDILHKCAARKTQAYSAQEMLDCIVEDILYCKKLLKANERIQGIGISCGGPLNSKTGTILSPPNLPGWGNIHITEYLEEKTGFNAWLCNDANACALAEWKLGAGKGCSNMIFMTFGTGLGAGIILNDQLYTGTNDMAGELGHIRLSDYGPVGYGKMGSFEGFCSGGGIAQLARSMIMQELQMEDKPALHSTFYDIDTINAEKVGLAAKDGDMLALEILKHVGIQLGKGLSILIDLLNPEKIIIGSIFVHCYDKIWPWAEQVIRTETLSFTREVCQVVPSQLSETVGDIAALIAAEYNFNLEIK
jgi:glucokinase